MKKNYKRAICKRTTNGKETNDKKLELEKQNSKKQRS